MLLLLIWYVSLFVFKAELLYNIPVAAVVINEYSLPAAKYWTSLYESISVSLDLVPKPYSVFLV